MHDDLTNELLDAADLTASVAADLARLVRLLNVAGGRMRARGKPAGDELGDLEATVDWCRRELMGAQRRLAPHAAAVRRECDAEAVA